MNDDRPRERQSDGRWDMTSQNDGRIRPIGYCAGWERTFGLLGLDDELTRIALALNIGEATVRALMEAQEASRPFRDHYHSEGHATEAEAAECYRSFLLDQRSSYSRQTDIAGPCRACGQETRLVAEYGTPPSSVRLCGTHQVPEVLGPLIEPRSIHS